MRMFVVGFVAVVCGLTVSAFGQNRIVFDNQSGDRALVKLVGPTQTEVDVPNGAKVGTDASAGRYVIKVRYGTPGNYSYSKGDEFTVTETATARTETTITLHKVVAGNYDARPISEAEFGTLSSAGLRDDTSWKTNWIAFGSAIKDAYASAIPLETLWKVYDGSVVEWEGIVSKLITTGNKPHVSLSMPAFSITFSDGRQAVIDTLNVALNGAELAAWQTCNLGMRVRVRTALKGPPLFGFHFMTVHEGAAPPEFDGEGYRFSISMAAEKKRFIMIHFTGAQLVGEPEPASLPGEDARSEDSSNSIVGKWTGKVLAGDGKTETGAGVEMSITEDHIAMTLSDKDGEILCCLMGLTYTSGPDGKLSIRPNDGTGQIAVTATIAPKSDITLVLDFAGGRMGANTLKPFRSVLSRKQAAGNQPPSDRTITVAPTTESRNSVHER